MFNRILVAVDGSENSDKALETVADLSKKYGSEVHIAFTINYQHYTMGLGLGTAMMVPQEELENGAMNLLKESSDKLEELGTNHPQMHSLSGDPGKEVTDLAKSIDADLVVCGSKGHSDISGILLGSVSHKICHLAHCACLVIR